MKRSLTAVAICFLVSLSVEGQAVNLPGGLYAEIQTNRGVIVVSLEFERTPMMVANFVGLAEGLIRFSNRAGKRFYDGLTFHRVSEAKSRAAETARKEREKTEALIRQKWPKAQTTATGLRYIVLKKGAGGSPAFGTKVTVHYTGSLLDGTVFDSSIERKKPESFRIGEVIPGWNEALMAMRKGEKRLLIIPPELGYGDQGYPGVILPNAFLVFEVELLDFS